MKHTLHALSDFSQGCHSIAADALIVLVSQTQAKAFSSKAAAKTPLGKLLADAQAGKDFSAATAALLQWYQPTGFAARRLILAASDSGSPAHEAAALDKALSTCRAEGIKTIAIAGFGHLPALVAAGTAALYAYDLTLAKKNPRAAQSLHFYQGKADKAAKAEFALALAQAEGVQLARELGNMPANYATPTHLAQTAQAIAKTGKNLRCKVLEKRDAERLKMGAFLSVAAASTQAPKFIELTYTGAGKAAPVVLVGKGITFDTGGISLKPGAGMDEMKYDMCGAASVLGVFAALARLQPKINVVGLIPTCENMPAGNATKPGDVVTAMDGTTIEVLNTDAEGRLILCDALCYAARFKPTAIVDIATLTGACVIALGGVRSGLFSNDDALAAALSAAGEAAQDLCWRMPLDAAYADGLKSKYADVANVAGREAGAVTAAKFLHRFVGNTPWAHLDIAGTAWKSGAAKGATGRPVGLLLQYLLAK
jgi:leucyl aminopeptidase